MFSLHGTVDMRFIVVFSVHGTVDMRFIAVKYLTPSFFHGA